MCAEFRAVDSWNDWKNFGVGMCKVVSVVEVEKVLLSSRKTNVCFCACQCPGLPGGTLLLDFQVILWAECIASFGTWM